MINIKKWLSIFIVGVMLCTNMTFVFAEDNAHNVPTQNEIAEEKQSIDIRQSSVVGQYHYSFTVKNLNSSYTWTSQAIQPNITLYQEKTDQSTGKTQTTKLVKNQDYTVQYKNNYRVGKASVIIIGKGNYKGQITKTFNIVQKNVKVSVSDIQSTSAKVQFGAINGTQKYVVQLKNTSGKVVKSATTTKTSVNFSSLSWNRKYKVEVIAYAIDGNKNSYHYTVASTSFTTKKATSKITVSGIQSTTAQVKFNAVKGAKKYKVQLKNTSGKVVKSVTTTKTSVNFSSLSWNRKYKVEVIAYATDENNKSYQYTVASTSFTTQKATTKVSISNIKTTSAQVKFNAVKGAKKYVVQLKNSSGKVVKTITTTKTSVTFTKLTAGKKYSVQVKAYATDELKKSYNAVVGTSSFTTLPTVAKVTLSSVKGGNEMAQVNWKSVSGASGYEIYRSTNAKSGFKKVKTVSNKTKSYTNYLLGVKTYYYKVRAYKKVNGKTIYGAYSKVKSCKTKKPTTKTYYLRVNCRTNVTTVYAKNFSGKYVAVKSLTTSCGVNGNTKPILGTHYTQAKYRWKYMHEDCYTQYATRITGHYLFHSIPYSKPKPNTMWYNSYNKLGNFASAGCVRLRVIDAKWIYDHCPLKTKTVVVYSKTDPLKKKSIARINTKSKYRNWDPTDPDPKNPWKK